MAANSRFAVAMHIMTALAYQNGEPISSETLALSVNTNAVVIRRILRQLAKAGLIVAQAGKGGGSHLARSAKQITLFDIYRAIDDADPLFAVPDKPANQSCAVSCSMRDLATEVFADAQQALARVLRKKRLSDLVAAVP
jgi:Rrf2 family protein